MRMNNYEIEYQEDRKKRFRAHNLGNFLVLESQEKPFTVYRFQICVIGEENKPENIKYIEKRYTDFYELHKALEIRFSNLELKQKLPQIPPKLSAFGTKTSI